ncbi:MAG: hypothetical protein LBE59_08545 [Nevskiaceae bacterium]|jgi:hypothetical protein|nr:hypothetical protein [Nevskiaceae bacterium]
MKPSPPPYLRFITLRPSSLLGRIALYAAGLIALVAGFLFIGVILIAGALAVVAMLILRWWFKQKSKRGGGTAARSDPTIIEGEYTIIDADARPDDQRRSDER